ncbi:MAG: 30S ribosomal protein S8 [Alphaproteobacteria bacterium]|nr:MAG: 30S ribosomal protein S8 [Alphaproteobacteria bacterium]TAF13229.1 MAG: 30S ribosomal protein S8 [Alphaproteobacteria bacterium]TAF40919.1 MAG: 30S ribosomal protein S8 [Alphaproteobacteria bacterium]TAF76875.1 MAG: 30S ribosomal protein S8 [Alphaproteobacteria bacterium]
MSSNDLLSDLLARLRNAQTARLSSIKAPYSNLLANVLSVLKDEGYIRGFEARNEGNKKFLDIELKYHEGQPVIRSLKRVSKPGRRSYSAMKDITPVYNGMGVVILSTDRGVLSDNQARHHNVGGEVLCYVF